MRDHAYILYVVNHLSMIVVIASLSHKNTEESLNCLCHANCATNIQNLATVSIDPHSKLVNLLQGWAEAFGWPTFETIQSQIKESGQ